MSKEGYRDMKNDNGKGAMRKVCIYCRVATDENNIIETQREELTRFANQHGFKITGSFQDIGSGLDYSRKGLSETLLELRMKKADAVLVKDISRIGRDISQNITYMKEINALGAEIISPLTGKIDVKLPEQVHSYFRQKSKKTKKIF